MKESILFCIIHKNRDETEPFPNTTGRILLRNHPSPCFNYPCYDDVIDVLHNLRRFISKRCRFARLFYFFSSQPSTHQGGMERFVVAMMICSREQKAGRKKRKSGCFKWCMYTNWTMLLTCSLMNRINETMSLSLRNQSAT